MKISINFDKIKKKKNTRKLFFLTVLLVYHITNEYKLCNNVVIAKTFCFPA